MIEKLLEDGLYLCVHTTTKGLPSGLDSLHRHCEEYETAIEEAGGIDLQLLGLGRMGHIGFNERGCDTLSILFPLITQVSNAQCLHGCIWQVGLSLRKIFAGQVERAGLTWCISIE